MASETTEQTTEPDEKTGHPNLTAALAAAQGEFPVVTKGKSAKAAGNYGFSYATMADYASLIYPILARHGLAYSCLPGWVEGKGFHMVGRLAHESGEQIEGVLPLSGTNAQQIGTSMSYARRQLFCALTGATADDETDPEKEQAKTAERATNPNARKSTKARAAKQAAPVAGGQQPDPWDEYRQEEQAGGHRISDAQRTRLIMLFEHHGFDRDKRMEMTVACIGRPVTSSNELTHAEAHQVIQRVIDTYGDLPPKEMTEAEKAAAARMDKSGRLD